MLSFIEKYRVLTQQEIDPDNMDIDVEAVLPSKYVEKLVSYLKNLWIL